jgi:hypothetical protein
MSFYSASIFFVLTLLFRFHFDPDLSVCTLVQYKINVQVHCALASHLHKGTRFDDHFDLFLGMQKPKTNKGQYSKYVVYCSQSPSNKVLRD